MNKEQKKEIEQKIILSIEDILSKHNAKAAEKISRHIREAGKTVAKKFAKTVKQQSEKKSKTKKAVKTNGIDAHPEITVAAQALTAVKKGKTTVKNAK